MFRWKDAMKNSAKSILLGSIGICFLGAILSCPARARYQNSQSQNVQNPGMPNPNMPNQNPPPSQNAHPARPGSINYVEGQATLGGQPLNPDAVGSVELDKGQALATQTGKVEILLTPGVFLRVADNSLVKMISPDLANTEVELDKGRAMVEVTDISKNNNIRVDLNGASVQVLKRGLYDFDADHSQVRVFKGKAGVFVNNQKVSVGENHMVALNASAKPKPQGFDVKQYSEAEIYRWSGLRSGYLAEADADTARLYVNGGPGWFGAGWYWDPWFGSYTFIPGDGIFYSPFGWGFYSPYAVWGSPFFYGGFGGYYGHGYHHFGDFHGPYGHGFEPMGGFRGGFAGGGFHGGSAGFHGGGGGHR
jgi:hypothetical protein